jgi:hypothetical protein
MPPQNLSGRNTVKCQNAIPIIAQTKTLSATPALSVRSAGSVIGEHGTDYLARRGGAQAARLEVAREPIEAGPYLRRLSVDGVGGRDPSDGLERRDAHHGDRRRQDLERCFDAAEAGRDGGGRALCAGGRA